jgi:NAD-dependent dihydropyrimidine dehydrogenase PreA subunit
MKEDEFPPTEMSQPETAKPIIIHVEPNPSAGEPPVVAYPQECWHEGACVEHCPSQGAVELKHPLMQRVRWKRKKTGEHFRV